jgi:hypothetical protein
MPRGNPAVATAMIPDRVRLGRVPPCRVASVNRNKQVKCTRPIRLRVVVLLRRPPRLQRAGVGLAIVAIGQGTGPRFGCGPALAAGDRSRPAKTCDSDPDPLFRRSERTVPARPGECGSRRPGRPSSLASRQQFGLMTAGGMTPRMTTERAGGSHRAAACAGSGPPWAAASRTRRTPRNPDRLTGGRTRLLPADDSWGSKCPEELPRPSRNSSREPRPHDPRAARTSPAQRQVARTHRPTVRHPDPSALLAGTPTRISRSNRVGPSGQSGI